MLYYTIMSWLFSYKDWLSDLISQTLDHSTEALSSICPLLLFFYNITFSASVTTKMFYGVIHNVPVTLG